MAKTFIQPENRTTCPHCQATVSIHSLLRHTRTFHPDAPPRSHPRPKLHACTICDARFVKVADAERHRAQPHDTTCTECGMACIAPNRRGWYDLRVHLMNTHGVKYQAPPKVKAQPVERVKPKRDKEIALVARLLRRAANPPHELVGWRRWLLQRLSRQHQCITQEAV